MKTLQTIIKKELLTFFDSFTAYVLLGVFLCITGFFTWFSDSNVFIKDQANLDTFFSISFWSLFFIIPALTMRLIAEEKRNGTFEWMLTKPVSLTQMLTAKFISSFTLIILAIVFTLPYYISVASLGRMDHGPAIGGYIGLLLLSATFISIGLFSGSITRNPVIAFLLTLFISLFFQMLSEQLSSIATDTSQKLFLRNISFNTHFESLAKGILDLRDIFFFISFSAIALLLTYFILSVKHQLSGKVRSYTLAAGSILLLIILNFFISSFYFRLDLTKDNRYSLSEATQKITSSIKEPVHVTFYYTPNINNDLDRKAETLIATFSEYKRLSNGKFSFTIIDPIAEKKESTLPEEIKPSMVSGRINDKVNMQKAYNCILFECAKTQELINGIPADDKMEYLITSTIKRIAATEFSSIAFITGHQEMPVEASADVANMLSQFYNIEQYSIDASTSIPLKYKTLIIIAPRTGYSPAELQRLDEYLQNGGNIYIAISRVQSNLIDLFIDPVPETGLEKWLISKGIFIEKDNIIDLSCGVVTLEQVGMQPVPIQMPYYPIFSNFSDHIITKDLESVLMTCPSSIQTEKNSEKYLYTPLIFSSEQSGTIIPPVHIDITKTWNASEFNQSKIPCAVAVESKTGKKHKLIVIANATFAINGHNGIEKLNPDNVHLAVNAIDWLSDDTGLISLRNKVITRYPLETISDEQRNNIKWMNLLLPLCLLLLLGVIQLIQFSKKKKQWSKGVY